MWQDGRTCMDYRLVFEEDGSRREVPLDRDEITIGRDLSADLVISDASVSRRHALLTWVAGRWLLQDLDSTNGTRVNDQRVQPGPAGARPAGDGDVLTLGVVRAELRLEATERLLLTREPPGMLSSQASITDVENLRALMQEPEPSAQRPDGGPAASLFDVLTALGHRVVALKPLEEIFEAVAELVFHATPADRAAILLWDEAASKLVPKMARERGQDVAPEGLRVPLSIVERSFRERCVVQVEEQISTSRSMCELGVGSAIAVPLWSESRTLGVIYADLLATTPSEFDARSLGLLSVVANYAAIAIEQNRLLMRVREEEQCRQRLERYFSGPVVDRILAHQETPDDFARAQECEVTVLFCDMVGFTELSERLTPGGVLAALNRYFARMIPAVFRYEGTLDKYIGDCIMAVFGAPHVQPDHARRAALAALEVRDVFRDLAARSDTGVRFDFRMGLSSGKVVGGNVGHSQRREWTVLGTTVNLASRMESEVAQPGQIVLTAATRDGLGDEFELKPLPSQRPRGISRQVEVYELIGRRD
jgi:adenylate cyclase